VTGEVTVTITREHGLHARPALELVKAVKAAGIAVTIGSPDGAAVDAGSLLAVMSQGFAQGAQVMLTATGEGSAAVLAKAAEILGGDD
jgi:phosphocarrier protein HPr